MYMGKERDDNALKSADLYDLISRSMFEYMFGIIVNDLPKCKNKNLDTVRKSINASFRNEMAVKMDYQLMLTAQEN